MNEELKTISQIAKELNVSRQTVYNRINNNPELSNNLRQCTVKIQNRTLYTLQAFELIKQEFEKSVKSNIDVKFTSNMIDTLTQQLTVKDSQIAALQSEVAALTDTVKELTVALKAAQALHGMDKQQATIEVKAAPTEKKNSEKASRSEPRRQPQRHKSWLERLLKR
jgi:DNA-binding LacI/PurR family transcriptional regulator